MSNALQTLVDALRQLPLLTSAQKVKLVRAVLPRYTESRSLAKQLLERGWLTPYQVNQLLAGRAEDLLVGAYILLERLGEGGTGLVFKARHQHMDRMVAIKMIRTEVLADQEVLNRFVREMEALGRLNHPNVVRAYDAGPACGNWFLAMEYVEGTDLNGLVKRTGPLPVTEACDVIRQAAQGLQAIHECGMIHRDLKPANLLQTKKKGIVKISDLGLARLLRPSDRTLTVAGSVMMGTVDYMAPEQAIDFHKSDIRSDIYSLGCCLYFLLTGRPPFDGGTIPQVLLAHQQKEPPPVRPEIPPRVLATLHKMLAKCPQDRFQTPGEIVAALANPAGVQPAAGTPYRQPVPGAGQQAGGRRRIAAPARSRRTLLAASFGVVAVGVVALLMLAFGRAARDLDEPRVNTRSGRPAREPINPKVTTQPSGPEVTAEPVYLTDLQEAAVEGMGYKTINRFSKHGKVCNGERITVKGVPSSKGLSTPVMPRGTAVLRYQLSKKYRELQGSAAIADLAALPKGQWPLTFSVSGDGRVLWHSTLADRGAPQAFAVNVSGVDRLDLMVSFPNANGEEYKFAGHAALGQASVWVDPRLVR